MNIAQYSTSVLDGNPFLFFPYFHPQEIKEFLRNIHPNKLPSLASAKAYNWRLDLVGNNKPHCGVHIRYQMIWSTTIIWKSVGLGFFLFCCGGRGIVVECSLHLDSTMRKWNSKVGPTYWEPEPLQMKALAFKWADFRFYAKRSWLKNPNS